VPAIIVSVVVLAFPCRTGRGSGGTTQALAHFLSTVEELSEKLFGDILIPYFFCDRVGYRSERILTEYHHDLNKDFKNIDRTAISCYRIFDMNLLQKCIRVFFKLKRQITRVYTNMKLRLICIIFLGFILTGCERTPNESDNSIRLIPLEFPEYARFHGYHGRKFQVDLPDNVPSNINHVSFTWYHIDSRYKEGTMIEDEIPRHVVASTDVPQTFLLVSNYFPSQGALKEIDGQIHMLSIRAPSSSHQTGTCTRYLIDLKGGGFDIFLPFFSQQLEATTYCRYAESANTFHVIEEPLPETALWGTPSKIFTIEFYRFLPDGSFEGEILGKREFYILFETFQQ
jgi:hypothetical protein